MWTTGEENTDFLPLSADNFDEVKHKISSCASFAELRASMGGLEGGGSMGGTARKHGGASSGQPGDGLPASRDRVMLREVEKSFYGLRTSSSSREWEGSSLTRCRNALKGGRGTGGRRDGGDEGRL